MTACGKTNNAHAVQKPSTLQTDRRRAPAFRSLFADEYHQLLFNGAPLYLWQLRSLLFVLPSFHHSPLQSQ